MSLRKDIETLQKFRAKYDTPVQQARAVLDKINISGITSKWSAAGANVFDGDDTGSIVAECCDVKSRAQLIADCVNAIVKLKGLLC